MQNSWGWSLNTFVSMFIKLLLSLNIFVLRNVLIVVCKLPGLPKLARPTLPPCLPDPAYIYIFKKSTLKFSLEYFFLYGKFYFFQFFIINSSTCGAGCVPATRMHIWESSLISAGYWFIYNVWLYVTKYASLTLILIREIKDFLLSRLYLKNIYMLELILSKNGQHSGFWKRPKERFAFCIFSCLRPLFEAKVNFEGPKFSQNQKMRYLTLTNFWKVSIPNSTQK